jgi:SAM-dependent methyltransferase
MEHQCPVCDSFDTSTCIKISNIPVFCNVLLATPHEAFNIPRGDIDLTLCRYCGHLFNSAFNSKLTEYNESYENSLHYSEHFQEYATSLANQLIKKYDLYQKTIIEIACGKGEFLALLCELGDNYGVGFDPSYLSGRINGTALNKINFVKDYYSESYASYSADLICCRHALEHIQFPRKFLDTVYKTASNKSNIFFEVPNVLFILKEMGIWDIIYEHCSYFSKQSLTHAFCKSGFQVNQVRSTFGDQFLCIDAFINNKKDLPVIESNNIENVVKFVSTFKRKYQEKIDGWKEALENYKKLGLNVVVWGAGSKGITFLNTLTVENEMGCIVDVNPNKYGKFIPGTAHQVVPPNFLKKYQPDIIIVMNPVYKDEIENIVTRMNLRQSILTA